MKNFLLAIIMITGLGSCTTGSTELPEEVQKLQWLEQADAEKQAEAALKQGDFRLMAMSQRGIVIPGVDRALADKYELKCGINLIDGISDAVRGEQHLELINKAHDYARQYNAIIIQHCKP